LGKSEPLVKEAGATGIDDIKGTGFVKDTHSLVNIKGYVDELETRLSAVRAGYLDNLNNANLATIPDISTLTAARIAHLDADISSRAAPSDILSDATPFAGADIAAIKGYVDELETRLSAVRAGYLDNLNNLRGGETENTATSLDLTAVGGGTSGEDGADVFILSTTTRKKIHFLGVSIANCTAAATITIRMYTKVLNADATLTKFYEQSFIAGTTPDLIPIIDGTLVIRNDLRVEMHSNNAGDNSVDVPYFYITEDME